MYRAQLRMKKSLEKKWQRRLDVIHLQRLTDIKARVNMSSPLCLKDRSRKKKQEQLMEGITLLHTLERYTEIEKANRILLEKITSIMDTKRETVNVPLVRAKSLNKIARKKKLQRIIDENRSLLKRLEDKKSRYNILQKQHFLTSFRGILFI